MGEEHYWSKADFVKFHKLSAKTFVEVNETNRAKIVDSLCTAIFATNTMEPIEDGLKLYDLDLDVLPDDLSFLDASEDNEEKEALAKMLSRLPCPYTIVHESYHIDSSYRDSYYLYFSNQHFNKKRYSHRLSFFAGVWDFASFFSDGMNADANSQGIEESFMGCCVLNPLNSGALGRTLIHPKYILPETQGPVYVRLSEYSVHILGKKMHVEAFPYRMQDGETMRCTEVTILNLLDHYSNSYHDYRHVVPREIIEGEQKHSHERVLPAEGITYPILTKVFSAFGFSPRLYSLSAIDQFPYSRIKREDRLRRWLHYYIESGIPVAVNLFPIGDEGAGHSIVCIGHGDSRPELKERAFRNREKSWKKGADAPAKESHPIINSADFYDTYVVVDDNEPVYQVRSFQQLSCYADMRVEDIAVPLYKRMFLDAPNASAVIMSLLQYERYRVDDWSPNYLDKQEPIVIRLFLASSHSFKRHRTETLKPRHAKEVYALTPMPRFVWVCELYRQDDYNDLNAFGEIVIDATSSKTQGLRSLIMMHYPGKIIVRYPQQTESEFDEIVGVEDDTLFPGFRNNLTQIF